MNLSDVARLERESGCKPVSDTEQRIDRSLRRHCPNGQLHPGRELLSDERSDGADLHCQLVRVHYGPVSPTPVSSHILIPAAACAPAPPRSDTTSAASTSYDGGSCSAGTPRTLPGHDHPPPELAITGPAANTPAGSCQPGLARTRSADYDLRPPLLLLDVDGVLNPFAAPACPPGYTEHDFIHGEEPVRLCLAHGSWLRELGTRFQIVWASVWGPDANRLLAPLLQLPDLPVIALPPVPFHPRDKLPAIIRYAGQRPLAWIDDALPPE